MKGLALTLPGGLQREGVVYRNAVLQPLTGRLEQVISEELDSADNLPQAVSKILGTALHSIGGFMADEVMTSGLCVADRQYLMMQLAGLIADDTFWLTGNCKQCSASFDICLQRSQLPVRQAALSYPWVNLHCAGHQLRLRIPSGDDQAAIADLDEALALRQLLTDCIVEINPAVAVPVFVDSLTKEDITRIDNALEAVSPAACTSVATQCPECAAQQVVQLDPYSLDVLDLDNLYSQVHLLACFYHWSESEILSLPRKRRQRYLCYIDAAQGVYA